jgi:hypothetical protein
MTAENHTSGRRREENENNEKTNLLVNDNDFVTDKNSSHWVNSNEIITLEGNPVTPWKASNVVAGAVGFTVGVGVAAGTFAGLSATSFWSNDKNTNTSLFCNNNNTINGTETFEQQPSNQDLRCALTGGMMINATLSGAAGVASAIGTYKLVQMLFDCMSRSDTCRNSAAYQRI